MIRHISWLPQEVLINIFNCLSVRDRLTASLVCSTWLHTVNCHRLLRDIQVTFYENNDEAIKLFSRMTRRFECFVFDRVIISESLVEFLKKYSSQFISLAFLDCNFYSCKCEFKFQDKILHCCNLKTLEVRDTKILFMFAFLPNVAVLKLSMSTGLSDYVISRLIKLFFKLEVLSLESDLLCGYEYSTNEKTIQSNPSDMVLSFASIKMLIEKNRTTLRYIGLSGLRLSNKEKTLLTISEIEGLKLRSVKFPPYLDTNCIKKFCENQFLLTSIHLFLSVRYSYDTLHVISKCLPNLQEFALGGIDWIDHCIIPVFQLQHLVKLDIYPCVGISKHSYREAVSNLKAFKLKHLNLASAEISDESLFELLKQNQNIRYLNLTNTSISNKTLNMISKNLRLLDCLILESCRNISDSGLTGEFEDSLTPTPLSNLKYLTKLDLSCTPLITNKGCIEAIRFPNLKRLSLYDCLNLNLNSNFKKELQKQNPSLQYSF